MRVFLIFFTCLFLFNCKKQKTSIDTSSIVSEKTEHEKPVTIEEELYHEIILDSSKLGLTFTPNGNYTQLLNQIETERVQFKKKYINQPEKTLDSVSDYILDTILNKITPHWYDTTWAFEGHTNIPNQGEIACGYFVSTTLKHFGFKLNRYKMAQQPGLNEALSLQKRSDLKIFRNIDYHVLKDKLLNEYSDGLFYVGLSNHVGYVLIKNREIYFLHSSYCDNKVVIEYAEYSNCFESDVYVFAEISTNTNLLKKWIFNEYIPIVN